MALYDLGAHILEEKNITKEQPDMLYKMHEIVKKEHTTPENNSFVIEAVEAL